MGVFVRKVLLLWHGCLCKGGFGDYCIAPFAGAGILAPNFEIGE